MQSGLIYVVVIAIIGSLIGVYYYFKPIIFAFNNEVAPLEKIETNFAFNFVLMAGIVLSLLLGIFPDILRNLPG